MRVAGIGRVGAPVEVIETGAPRPLAGDEVLLEVMAAGVGNWDEFVRVGGWDVGAVPPMALGVEAAGTVAAVGGAVSDWMPGDAVMTHPVPLREQGTWAPMLIAPAALLARKPHGVSWEAAAAFPIPALTAEQVLSDALRVRAGEHLLVHGAGGVTGGLLVALAALRGAQVIATAGPSSLRAVADGGRLATITSDPPAEQRGITVSSVYVRPDGRQLRDLATRFGDGRLEIPVGGGYRLADAARALARVTGGHAGGAVVLTP
jgi:NADPH:quinone reductase-like Zn-dependent oxidoreductase